MSAQIPDKLYFKIGEVAKLAALRPSVLRYWETEFTILMPGKSQTGQRLYSRAEVELVFDIKQLLYCEKLTIEGARKKLKNRGKRDKIDHDPISLEVRALINDVKADLQNIRNLISNE